jgi:chromosome segregation ATPase
LTKTNGIKIKLETLCRELQRQNKTVLEESKRVATDEQAKRQELSRKFHTTIKEITTKMEEQGEERMNQLKENEMLREKLKNVVEQYEIRERHIATQLKAKDLERALIEAKLKQQADIALQEALKAQAYKEQIASLAHTETELRNQLSIYAEKFEQFQETLVKSNDVFSTFKSEMERMTKQIKRLEKENGSLKKKSEQSDVTLIELVEERNSLRKQLDTARTQKQKLEGLCRALQAERNATTPTSSSTPTSTSTTSSENSLPTSTSPSSEPVSSSTPLPNDSQVSSSSSPSDPSETTTNVITSDTKS